ncbi:site-specific integrase [Saccharopolyspora sp. NPDC050389]|uniref:tyrosine-type recombinase/integrase n=1 Tax=Saccharopolyspora sp. NPDC050389 TaxID=3155516 RepID=UPI0033ED9535
MPVGTYGAIKTRKLSEQSWEAFARYRSHDGSLVPVKRRDRTKNKAENRLRDALKEATENMLKTEIKPTTRITAIAELWYTEIQREATLGDRSPETVRLYRSYLDNWILPYVGQLRAVELTVSVCDRTVKRAQDKKSYDTAKTVRAALSGMCGYAVRHGALTTNPVRSIGRLVRGEQKEVRALTADQRSDLLAKLEALGAKRAVDARGRSLGPRARIWSDLPDLVRAMLSTGARIGEVLAFTGAEFDADGPTIAVDYHIIRVQGAGLVRRKLRKGNQGGLLLRVPTWSVPMLSRRAAAAGDEGPLFPSARGGWLDPSNVINRISEAFDECGYGWVTSHVFRKTVATVLDEAGLPVGDVADQLGNTRKIAEKHYIARKVANKHAANALEDIIESDS